MSSENPENILPNSINDDSNWIDEDEPTFKKSESNLGTNPPQANKKTLVMVETAFLASTASLIWLINFYFPLGPLLKIFFPIPLAFLCLRRGVRAGWMAMLVSGLLLSVLMGPSRSILYLMPYGLMGVQLGILWLRGSGWLLSILIGTIIGTIGFFFRFWLFSVLLGEDVWVYVISQFTGDTYRFNLREAVLKAGLIKESGQIFFLEEAIASLIARSEITPGLTLLINSGASNTELGIVDIPANLHELKYTDFTLQSFAYAGNAFDQDILFELIYPQLQELQQYLHTLDQECPQIGEPDQQRRDYVNLLLGSHPIGHSLLEAAKLVKLVLQQRSEFASQLGNDYWIVRREELNSLVIPPFEKLLEQQINLLLQKTKKQATDITQIICTGGTSIGLKKFLSIWLAEKFPQAQLRQDTDEENILRVAKGLASLPLFPNILDRPRHQYSDYFLLLELLETIPNKPFKIEELMGLLARRGINTRVCSERLVSFLKGELPTGLITNDPRLHQLLAISECLDNSRQNYSLLLKDYEGNYRANSEVCEILKQYLKFLLTQTQQQLTEPLIVNLPLVVS